MAVATAINKTVVHPTWFVPMSYHRLVRVENDLVTHQVTATFASYFSKAAYDNKGQPLSYTSVITENPNATDNTDIITLAAAAEGDLKGGEVI